MLRQEELAFIKAINTLQLSPALLRGLRIPLLRRKKAEVAARSRSTTCTDGATASQRSSSQLADKRKANELASSGELLEPANRSPAPGDGSAPLHKSASAVTGEQAATCRRQLGASEGGVNRIE
jgi:hypothetical protein